MMHGRLTLSIKNTLWNIALLAALLLCMVLLLFAMPSRPGQAAPFPLCSSHGYLFKYPSGPTQIHTVDMVTGDDAFVAEIFGREINAIGYNPKDNFIYGWDDANDTFVRVHSDLATVDNLTISGYTGPTTGVIIGDVDDDGYFWQLDGNTWHQIDLNTPTPTQVATGTPGTNPTGTAGADWAFVPGTDNLYRTMDNGATVTVWAFNRTSKTWSSVGTVSGISAAADRVIGANYADPSKNLYASSNSSGKLWRINLDTLPLTAVHIGTGNSSSSNDGARCSTASVPTDFGDAPSSYTTLISDPPTGDGGGGPRHNVIGFNDSDSTAPLMLGTKIDIENDGLPGTNAAGDDDNHVSSSEFVDDERGVTHIVVSPGVSTALSIPVYVTNDNSQAATLAGWVDLNNNGSFETGERATVSVPANTSGTFKLDFPATTFTANTYARFRVFQGTVADPQPVGPAAGGEVEDVLVQVGSYSVAKASDPADGSIVDAGSQITYTLTITNTGATALANLKIQDDLTGVLDDATFDGNATVNPASAGTTTFQGNSLDFTGDIGAGEIVTVTYKVTVKAAGALGDGALGNMVLAAHSANCHPDVNNQAASVDHEDCVTQHTANKLADTGTNMIYLLLTALGLTGVALAVLHYNRRQQQNK